MQSAPHSVANPRRRAQERRAGPVIPQVKSASHLLIESIARWLTPRRIRAQAIVLALCLWGVCAVDFATPGLFDRAGNIKFQDFLQFYISAHLIRQGRTDALYDQNVADQEMRAIAGDQTRVRLPTVYGPQVGLAFVPLARFSFPAAARLWVVISVAAYRCLPLS